MSQRIKEIDFLKSILILLMVAFHLVYIGDKYPYAKLIVYTFHMPAFLIISGYLADEKKDAGAFLRKQMWIFIPYVFMEIGYVVMSHILPVREGVPQLTLPVLLNKIFIHPLGPYWYLHTLIVCSLLHYLVFRCKYIKTESQILLFGLLLFAASYGAGLVAFANAIYFLAGVALRQSNFSFTRFFRPSFFAVIPLVVLCCFPANLDRGTLAGVVITYLAISILLHVYNYLPQSIRDYSSFIGSNTLAIFLFSPVFTILCRMFLSFLLVDTSGMLFMIVSVGVTVGGCIAIAWGMDKLRISPWLMGKKLLME